MKNFFNPKSVAIIGASTNDKKIGNILIKNLSSNKKVEIYPINPKETKIEGRKCYSSVLDVEKRIDLAIVAVPASIVFKIIEECAWRKNPIKNIIIISAGFSETGVEGQKLQEKIKKMAQRHDLKIMGPNCLGTINTKNNFNASFAKNDLHSGRIGLIMQSGAMTTALLDRSGDEGLGFSFIATLGNKMMIDESDLIEFYLQEKTIDVITLYIEDIRNGRKFKKILQEAKDKKPVVVIKGGKTKKSQEAIISHTGAMASENDVLEAVLAETGTCCCNDLKELTSVLKLLSTYPAVKSNKVTIITNAGGPGVMTTDLVEKKDSLEITSLSEETKKALKKFLPAEASVENPVDLLGDALSDRYKNSIETVLRDKNSGSIIAIITPQSQTPVKEIRSLISALNKKTKKIILPVLITRNEATEKNSSGHVHFTYPSEAVNALNIISTALFKKSNNASDLLIEEEMNEKAKEILLKVDQEERNVLYYNEACKFMKLYGLDTITAAPFKKNKIDTKIKYPLVMKIDSTKILHKKSEGGVIVDIKDKKHLLLSLKKMRKKFPTEKIIGQTQVASGLELIVGYKKDETFGPTLMIGLGGVAAEVFEEKILFTLPQKKEYIKNRLKNHNLGKILQKECASIDDLLEIAKNLSQAGLENQEIKEIDLNPVIFYSEKNPAIVDIKVLLNN